MQNNRLILWGILGLLAFMLYTKWQTANAPESHQVVEQSQTGKVPNISDGTVPTIDETVGEIAVIDESAKITVKTDVLSVDIALLGGDIVGIKLINYPESLEEKNLPFTLLSSDPKQLFISQTGLIGATGSVSFPHTLPFSAEQKTYELQNGQNALIVPVMHIDPETGSQLTKIYEFKRGSYDISFTQKIENKSSNLWRGINYVQFLRKDPETTGHLMGASSYTGPVYSMGKDTYQKIPFNKITTNKTDALQSGTIGWVAMIQQYFTTAWLALNEQPYNVEVHAEGQGAAVIRLKGTDIISIPVSESYEFKNTFYSGPKLKEDLLAAGEYTNAEGKPDNARLELTLDYGWFSIISTWMFIILNFFHDFVHNWGWSIILLTLTVKLLLYPLSEKGYRSMARMRHLAPEMQRLKELYGNDKQKIGQETIALYRKEKVNPMGGCWPMLIQIPIFISLFWMLQESVQLRQAPWIFWIHDLAVRDPYFILPIIMCGTMFVQQLFNPPPPDPMQAKIMKFMPLVFGFMFMWFAAGIVLYWIMNNLLTILQQWIINRRIESASKKNSAVVVTKDE